MAWMRPIAQSIHHPDIHALQRRNAGRWQVAQIAGIGKTVESKPEGLDIAVLLQNRQSSDGTPCPRDVLSPAGLQPMLVEYGRVFAAGGRAKAIAKTREQSG